MTGEVVLWIVSTFILLDSNDTRPQILEVPQGGVDDNNSPSKRKVEFVSIRLGLVNLAQL